MYLVCFSFININCSKGKEIDINSDTNSDILNIVLSCEIATADNWKK